MAMILLPLFSPRNICGLKKPQYFIGTIRIGWRGCSGKRSQGQTILLMTRRRYCKTYVRAR